MILLYIYYNNLLYESYSCKTKNESNRPESEIPSDSVKVNFKMRRISKDYLVLIHDILAIFQG